MRSLQEGAREAYVLAWPIPEAEDTGDSLHAVCFVVMKREQGLLMAVPAGFIPMEDFHSSTTEGSVMGPHLNLQVPGVTADASDSLTEVGVDLDVVLVDLAASATGGLVLFADSGIPENLLLGFHLDDVSVVPSPDALLVAAREWISSFAATSNFYSAEEGEMEAPGEGPKAKAKAKEKAPAKAKKPSPMQVAEHIQQIAQAIPALSLQMQSLQEEQARMSQMVYGQGLNPPVRAAQAPVAMSMHNFAKLMGPPPRTKGPPAVQPAVDPVGTVAVQPAAAPLAPGGAVPMGDPLAAAVLEQSKALTSLVAHLSGGDPLIDARSMSLGTSSRGAQGREKLQKELAARSGGFLLMVVQNAFRRLKPASPLPQSLAEVAATDFSMLQYLKEFGGYGNTKELGLIQYALAFVVDAAVRQEMEGIQEHLALLLVGLEQASMDQNRWDLAFQLMLLEDPPPGVFSYRGAAASQASTGRARSFAPLCPQRWTTIALAYVKEIDYIQSRRAEVAKKAAQPQQDPAPSPKRRGKFPKGKGGDADQQLQKE